MNIIETRRQMTMAHIGSHHSEGATSADRATLEGWQCTYGDAIKPRDIVVANFDLRRVSTGGGLYLVQQLPGCDDEFRACRRMMRVPDGVMIDQDGHGDWSTFDSPEAAGWEVVGTIETIYRPTDYY